MRTTYPAHALRLSTTALAAWVLAAPATAQNATTDKPLESSAASTGEAENVNEEAESEEIIVQATRSRRRVQNEPIRVEVLGREEIEEKIAMRPGNISMLLAETGGVRVQVTSPSLGAANVRVQGMDGRYTQLLADGLPLYGGQSSSLGLLQIAPTDLGRVEVIKGAASALYGPSALGGVINLVSRRPSDEPGGEILLNATSRNGQDATAYASSRLSGNWSGSLTGGYNRQTRQDVDDDGWTDMPAYDRWSMRPRVFWEGENGATVFLTAGAMTEVRKGGTMPNETAPDGNAFPLEQRSRRYDAGLVAEVPIRGVGQAQLRASGMSQTHKHTFGDVIENDRHRTAFVEGSLSGGTETTPWVAGIAFQADDYRSRQFPAFNYSFKNPGAFAQLEHDFREDLTVAGSARLDLHSEYGAHLSPRVSMLYRPGPWRFRASVGRGFYAPTPFVDEIDEAGLSRLEPLGELNAETAQTGSVDVGYVRGPFEATATLFASNIDGAVRIEQVGEKRVRLTNVDGTTKTRGAELLLRYRLGALTVTGSYVYVRATEPDESGIGRRAVPLTPKHTGGIVAMWEREGVGRIGAEAYYTGRQALEDDPFRTVSRPYVELGVMGELVVGKMRLFVNAENLLGVRQTRFDPIVRPSRAPDGRWTVDNWAPLEGFVLNGGVRLRFGKL